MAAANKNAPSTGAPLLSRSKTPAAALIGCCAKGAYFLTSFRNILRPPERQHRQRRQQHRCKVGHARFSLSAGGSLEESTGERPAKRRRPLPRKILMAARAPTPTASSASVPGSGTGAGPANALLDKAMSTVSAAREIDAMCVTPGPPFAADAIQDAISMPQRRFNRLAPSDNRSVNFSDGCARRFTRAVHIRARFRAQLSHDHDPKCMVIPISYEEPISVGRASGARYPARPTSVNFSDT